MSVARFTAEQARYAAAILEDEQQKVRCPVCGAFPNTLRVSQNGAGPSYDCDSGCNPAEIAPALERAIAPAVAEPDTFALLGFDELLALPDLAFVIEGLVPLDGLSVIFGAPGSFKSFLALDCALCVATGLPWFGRQVRRGYVIYIAAEGRGGLKQRVVSWWESHDRPDMSRARFLPEAVNLLDRAQIARTRATLASLPERARLMTVDTMARSMPGGDENSAQDVGRFIQAVDGLRATEAAHVVHHTGKDGKDERGSSALRGAADLMVKTSRDGKSPKVTVVCDKAKDFEPWPDLTMQREIAGDSCVLSMVQDADSLADLRRRVLAHVAEHGPVTQNAIEKAIGGRASAVREALKSLDRNNRIHRAADGWQEVRPKTGTHRDALASQAPGRGCVPPRPGDGPDDYVIRPAGRTHEPRPDVGASHAGDEAGAVDEIGAARAWVDERDHTPEPGGAT
jgi:hypothetical protein